MFLNQVKPEMDDFEEKKTLVLKENILKNVSYKCKFGSNTFYSVYPSRIIVLIAV